MTAIILLPTNSGGYDYAKIYRSSSISGEYILIDTVNSVQLEYEDSDGDYSKYYQIAWYDGTTESTKIPVQSLVQKIINIVRIECKVGSTVLPDSEIDFLIPKCQKLIQLDICKFYYGVQIYKIEDDYYQLPGHYYYDVNCGGIMSMLDVSFFKQAAPITQYSAKIPVYPISIDFDDYWVQIPGIESTDVLKFNYYTVGRRLESELLYELIAYRICAIYFNNLATDRVTETSSSPYSNVKIGPISITNGTSSITTSINAIVDLSNKMTARYNKLITNFKTGFYRVN